MTAQPRYENGVPMCQASCQHYEDGDHYSVQFSARCKLDGSVTEPSVVCLPAVAAQAAELERLRNENAILAASNNGLRLTLTTLSVDEPETEREPLTPYERESRELAESLAGSDPSGLAQHVLLHVDTIEHARQVLDFQRKEIERLRLLSFQPQENP